MQDLGRRIRATRILRGLTQQDLAEMVHVDRTTVTAWELAHRKPDPVDLGRLADALGTTIDWMVTGRDGIVVASEIKGANPKASSDDRSEANLDWPEGVQFLRRASKELTPDMKRKVIRAMEQFLEEDKTSPDGR